MLDHLSLRVSLPGSALLTAEEILELLPVDLEWISRLPSAARLPGGAVYRWADVVDAVAPLPESPAHATALTVDQARARLHCGRTKLFEMLATGQLVSAGTAGKETLVLASSVEAFLDNKSAPPRVRAPAKSKRSIRDIKLTG